MKNLKLSFAFLAIISLFVVGIFSGCSKMQVEEQTETLQTPISEILYIENEKLTFPAYEAYNRTIDNVLAMDDSEFGGWEKKLGFNSLRGLQIKVIDKLQLCKTSEDVYALADKYSKYFEVRQDLQGEQEFVPKIESLAYASIANIDGEFAFGSKVKKVIGKYIVTVKKEDYELLEEVSEKNVSSFNSDKRVEVDKYVETSTEKAYCGKDATYWATKNRKWCNNDRRVHIKFYIYNTRQSFTGGTSIYAYYSQVKVWGQRKFGCIWGNYKTKLYLDNIRYAVRYPDSYDVNTSVWSWRTKVKEIPNWSGESRGKTVTEKLNLFYSSAMPPSNYSFTKYKGNASSRGVNGIWVRASCGY